MKKKKLLSLGIASVMVCSSLFTGCGQKAAETNEVTGVKESAVVEETDAVSQEVSSEAAENADAQASDSDIPQLEGYELLWNDEFDGTEMNMDIWDYDPHEPGWTNNELQEYTVGTENVFVRDGKLVLKAIKTTDENGNDYYTSGKVKTQGKKDFMYGKVVARAKVPEGKGLWPAIWMMPTDEGYYGQWPKCGEIDIMEVLGNQTSIAYSTIHYGEPHAEQQGKLQLTDTTFADDFHDYSVEWEPGEMRFYIDTELVLTAKDWFTAVPGEDNKPYPAPFDQPFYVQMNLAVGGNWPGNPDETTNFDNAEFEIDYVRVYQKPEHKSDLKQIGRRLRMLFK